MMDIADEGNLLSSSGADIGAGASAGADNTKAGDVPANTIRRPRSRKSNNSNCPMDAARTPNACQVCRQKKVKCDGQRPCQYCAKRQLNCIFYTNEKRKLYSVSQVRELERKVARYESQHYTQEEPLSLSPPRGGDRPPTPMRVGRALHSEFHADSETTTTPRSQISISATTPGISSPASFAISDHNPTSSTFTSSAQQRPPPERGSRLSILAGAASGSRVIAPESSLSSSETFGSEIRTFLVSHSNAASTEGTTATTATPPRVLGLSELERLREWPSTACEARELLELVTLNVGISQQLFDIRPFSDTLSTLYDNFSTTTSFPPLWSIKALLIMAIGRLLAANDPDLEVPGESLFKEAIKSLPSLGSLLKHEIEGIEVTALAALFLQVADRKEEAYLYASTSLRLAISHGMHKTNHDKQLHSSDSVHRNRLWWTVYMQERRLAAAGGHPITMHDRAITAHPPEDIPGFPSAAAIAINVRAARITGQITWTIYSQTNTSETSFITDMQDILHSLDELERSMPAEYIMELRQQGVYVAGRPFCQSHIHTARTSSSLYLSLYLAAVHAVRPILLYMARRSREHDTDQHGIDQISPVIRRLAELCVEAASKSLLILQELRSREILAKHAFLDLDAIFSVGFVFVLVQAISPSKSYGASGIEASRSILRYLAQLGNRAASRRLMELDQMCTHLCLPHYQCNAQSLPSVILSHNFSFERGYYSHDTAPTASPPQREWTTNRPGHGYNVHVSASAPGEELATQVDRELPTMDSYLNMSLSDISLEGEGELLWAFQPGYYTGAELTDWETLGQHIPEMSHALGPSRHEKM